MDNLPLHNRFSPRRRLARLLCFSAVTAPPSLAGRVLPLGDEILSMDKAEDAAWPVRREFLAAGRIPAGSREHCWPAVAGSVRWIEEVVLNGRHIWAVSIATCLLAVAATPLSATTQAPAPPAEGQAAPSTQSPAEQVARQYVAAYSAADWDAMEPFMSDDFVLVDRTHPQLAGQKFEGRSAVLAMLRDFGERGGVRGLFLDFPVVFESSGIVVFTGHVNTLSRAPEVGFGLRWRADQVTILTVREGKVVRHEDFANYGGAVITREPLAAGQ